MRETDRQVMTKRTYAPERLATICYQLAAQAYPHGAPWRETTFVADIEAPQTHYDLLMSRERPIGFISYSVVLDEVEITNVAIHPDFRRLGHARWLLTTCLERLTVGDQVFLEVRASNRAAYQLYSTCGFKTISKRKQYYHDPVEDALIMRKIID